MKLKQIFESLNKLTEDRTSINQSRVLSDSIYNNVNLFTKKGGPISVAIKSRSGANTAEIIFRASFSVIDDQFKVKKDDGWDNWEQISFSAKFIGNQMKWKLGVVSNNISWLKVPFSSNQSIDDGQFNSMLNELLDDIKMKID